MGFPRWTTGPLPIASAPELARYALDAILPPRCLACGAQIAEQGALCAGCWSDVRFIAGTVCTYCGLPLETWLDGPSDEGADTHEPICEHCIDQPPIYETARAPLRYEATARRLILSYKHRDRIEGARAFARWMVGCAGEMLSRDPLLIPVPLHRWRLLGRGYNQSGLLAGHIARLTGLRCLTSVLTKRKGTASQQGLSANARRENITAGVFSVTRSGARLLRGRNVVLIDDVLTTGATVNACADVLLSSKAERVDVLTLARVVRDEGMHI